MNERKNKKKKLKVKLLLLLYRFFVNLMVFLVIYIIIIIIIAKICKIKIIWQYPDIHNFDITKVFLVVVSLTILLIL